MGRRQRGTFVPPRGWDDAVSVRNWSQNARVVSIMYMLEILGLPRSTLMKRSCCQASWPVLRSGFEGMIVFNAFFEMLDLFALSRY